MSSDTELFFHLKGPFVGSWLFLHTTPSIFGKYLVHAWRKCGGLTEAHSIFQTHIGMPRGVRLSLALNEPK